MLLSKWQSWVLGSAVTTSGPVKDFLRYSQKWVWTMNLPHIPIVMYCLASEETDTVSDIDNIKILVVCIYICVCVCVIDI